MVMNTRRTTYVKVIYSVTSNEVCREISLGFHNRLNRRIQRAHANIWAFIRCLVSEESRFQHVLIRFNTGSERRPKSTSADNLQKRIVVLNQRFDNKEINADELLNGLSLLIGNKK